MGSIHSQSRRLEFGPDLPLLLVGERINPSGKAELQADLLAGKLDRLDTLAREQEAAGAQVLGVNLGLAGADEARLLVRAVEHLVRDCQMPLYLDSSLPQALQAARLSCPHKPLLGSCTGEEHSYRPLLDFACQHPAAVVVLLHQEGGIPSQAKERLAVADKVLDYAQRISFPPEDLVFDCLALAVGADPMAARVCLDCISTLAGRGLSTIVGLSNVSFGLPLRQSFNRAFAAMAVAAGLAAVILNPNSPGMVDSVLAAEVLAARDPYAGRFLAHYRARKQAGERQVQM